MLRKGLRPVTAGLTPADRPGSIRPSSANAMNPILDRARRLAPAVPLVVALLAARALAAESGSGDRALPAPRMTGGKPLLDALKDRQSRREFKPDPLSEQQLSDLLWAAFGINRPAIDHRTAPSAQNSQDVDVYVALADGLFLYEAKPHRLKKLDDGDRRLLTTSQDTLKPAPIQLIFVSDFSRMARIKPDMHTLYAGVDTGCLVQNVYLFCASEGLATVVHEVDRPPLAQAMRLRPEQHIILAQAVGLPR
jgi:SagB-type dehydrogenase family enzyme